MIVASRPEIQIEKVMMKIFHIADLHLGLRLQNHPGAREILVQARNETQYRNIGLYFCSVRSYIGNASC